MSELKKRKLFSSEFKAKVGLEAVRGGKTINEMAQVYGVHPVQISHWKVAEKHLPHGTCPLRDWKALQKQAKTLFENRRRSKAVADHEEPERLYREIGRLKMELDWLKKSLGYACHCSPCTEANARNGFGRDGSRPKHERGTPGAQSVSVLVAWGCCHTPESGMEHRYYYGRQWFRLAHGFAYLVVILDWYSRKVLAWRISNTMEFARYNQKVCNCRS